MLGVAVGAGVESIEDDAAGTVYARRRDAGESGVRKNDQGDQYNYKPGAAHVV